MDKPMHMQTAARVLKRPNESRRAFLAASGRVPSEPWAKIVVAQFFEPLTCLISRAGRVSEVDRY
jgi:hypothetical protein